MYSSESDSLSPKSKKKSSTTVYRSSKSKKMKHPASSSGTISAPVKRNSCEVLKAFSHPQSQPHHSSDDENYIEHQQQPQQQEKNHLSEIININNSTIDNITNLSSSSAIEMNGNLQPHLHSVSEESVNNSQNRIEDENQKETNPTGNADDATPNGSSTIMTHDIVPSLFEDLESLLRPTSSIFNDNLPYNEVGIDFFSILPNELIKSLLRMFLDRSDRKSLRCVSRHFRRIIDELFPLILHFRDREVSNEQLKCFRNTATLPQTVYGVNFRGRVDLSTHADIFSIEFSTLRYIDLSYHDGVTDATLSLLPSSLNHLNIRGCYRITDDGLPYLKNLSSLEYLSIRACVKITDEGLRHLPTGLHSLDLESLSKISNEGIAHLPIGLKRLNLSCCSSIGDDAIRYLPRSLQHLDLSNCEKLTDEGLSFLPPSLLHLNLASSRFITDNGIQYLPKTLKYLDLGSCTSVTDAGVKNLPPGINHLVLSSCGITDRVFKYLPRFLVHLNLSWCKRITGEAIKELSPSIQHLDLSFCRMIKDNGLCYLPSNLRFLSLTYCPITGEGLKNLPSTLQHLSLNNCSQVTDVALMYLPKCLKRLSIFHCDLLSSGAISNLRQAGNLIIDR